MKVFISWSGERSKFVAAALREWIPVVLQSAKPWMSDADIGAGARWAHVIGTQLEDARFGILCLTPENLEHTWIHFEAGALAKQVKDAFVCPYLVGLEPEQVPAGPLAQFHAKRADEKGTLDLLRTINEAAGESALETATLDVAFTASWPRLESKLKQVPAVAGKSEPRPVDDMVKEILEVVRDIDRRVEVGPQSREWKQVSNLARLGVSQLANIGALALGQAGTGVAYVPASPSVRQRIGSPPLLKTTDDEESCPLCDKPISRGQYFFVRSADNAKVHSECFLGVE